MCYIEPSQWSDPDIATDTHRITALAGLLGRTVDNIIDYGTVKPSEDPDAELNHLIKLTEVTTGRGRHSAYRWLTRYELNTAHDVISRWRRQSVSVWPLITCPHGYVSERSCMSLVGMQTLARSLASRDRVAVDRIRARLASDKLGIIVHTGPYGVPAVEARMNRTPSSLSRATSELTGR